MPLRIPRRVVLIVVDADRDFDYGWDSKEHPLGLRALLGSVGQVTVSHYSFETIELFKETMVRLSRERTGPSDSAPLEITTYVIELHFNQLANESDRHFLNTVPTSLQLPSKSVDRLEQLARVELRNSRVGGADGLKGTRPKTVPLRPSSNRTGGFPASGFPRVIHSHRFYAATRVHAARVGNRYRP